MIAEEDENESINQNSNTNTSKERISNHSREKLSNNIKTSKKELDQTKTSKDNKRSSGIHSLESNYDQSIS